MHQLTKKLLVHPLIKGSMTLIIGGLSANLFNFLFNIFMTHNISPANYGILASITSIITLATIPAAAVSPTLIRFSAEYFANKDYDHLRSLYRKIGIMCLLSGTCIFCIFLLFTKDISYFFKITNDGFIILAGLTIFVGYLSIINISLLQAKLSFTFLSFVNFMGSFVKFILGFSFVSLGFSLLGAIWAFFFSFLIPYLISFLPLTFIFKPKTKDIHISTNDLLLYGGPAALSTFSLMSFITTDILLVKHFFSPQDAGIYAGISLIAKVIFYISAPIGTVMFPLIVQRHAKGEKYKQIFLLSVFLVFSVSFILTVFYYFFPSFTIRFFAKDAYLQGKQLLTIFGLTISFYAVLTIMTNYFLSVRKTRIAFPLFIGAFLQAILIWFYHTSLFQVIFISGSILGILFLIFLLYYVKTQKNET